MIFEKYQALVVVIKMESFLEYLLKGSSFEWVWDYLPFRQWLYQSSQPSFQCVITQSVVSSCLFFTIQHGLCPCSGSTFPVKAYLAFAPFFKRPLRWVTGRSVDTALHMWYMCDSKMHTVFLHSTSLI